MEIDALCSTCDEKQASYPLCKHGNYWRAFCTEPQILQRVLSHWWCVWLPSFPHTWFVFQSGSTRGGAPTSCAKAENAEGVKREPTDPHKQALSFMASVTPSLLKSDSQMFKHYWSAPLFLLPPNPITTLKLFSFSHTIHPLKKSSSYIFPSVKKKNQHPRPIPRNILYIQRTWA